MLSKDDRVGKTIHPVRQLISKLKPLRLTSNDGSQIGPKDDSRFNEAAAKNSGMHLLRKFLYDHPLHHECLSQHFKTTKHVDEICDLSKALAINNDSTLPHNS
ncbi:unnamed protein product [Toxocara canis]|uniref:Uncharacterized protein n=1 Tax=Toxocara canis TaxID=6265 RepID=A0A3P7H9B1_TOXCA|nr:unnamed protein product [Toxocara canis]